MAGSIDQEIAELETELGISYGQEETRINPIDDEITQLEKELGINYQVVNPEPEQNPQEVGGFLKTAGDAWEAAKQVPRQAAATLYKAGDEFFGGVEYDDFINGDFASKAAESYANMLKERGNNVVTRAGQNIGYSLSTMGPSLAAGAVGSALGPMGTAGAAAGTAGAISYNAAKNDFMRMTLDALNEEYKELDGRNMTKAEFEKAKSIIDEKGTTYGLWEALPEAVGGAFFGSIVFRKLGGIFGENLTSRIAKKAASLYGEELATETITQIGQNNAEKAVGTKGSEKMDERSFLSGSDWYESFKEIAPDTLVSTTFLAGMGGAASKLHDYYLKKAKGQEPTPEEKAEVADAINNQVEAGELKAEDVPQEAQDEFGLGEYKGNSLLVEDSTKDEPVGITTNVSPVEEVRLPKLREDLNNRLTDVDAIISDDDTATTNAEAYEEENLEPELTTENWKQFFIDQYGDEAEIASDEAVADYMWNPDADFVKPPEDILEAYTRKVGGNTDIDAEIEELENDPDVQAALGLISEDVTNQSNDAQQMIENDQIVEANEMVDNKVVNKPAKVDNIDQTNESALAAEEQPTIEQSSAVQSNNSQTNDTSLKEDLKVEQDERYPITEAKDKDGNTVYHVPDYSVHDDGRMWTIHKTREDAERMVEFNNKADVQREKNKEDIKQREEEEARKKAEYENVDGFTEGMDNLARGKALKTLNSNVNGKPRKQHIKELLESGWKIEGDRLVDPEGYFKDEKTLTKTGINYAKHLESLKEDKAAQEEYDSMPDEDKAEVDALFTGKQQKETKPPLYTEEISEKAFVVKGMTKETKDVWKQGGGKWNKKAGGWMFPQSRKDEVMERVDFWNKKILEKQDKDRKGPDIEVAYIGDKKGAEAEKVKKDIEGKITEKITGERDFTKPIGKNINGKDVYEDENGVRSYTEGNFKISEPVAIIPGRGGMAKDSEDRIREKRYDHLTVEEVDNAGIHPNKAKGETLANEPETSDNIDTQENKDELLQQGTRTHEEVSAEQVSDTQEPGETGRVPRERGAGSLRYDLDDRGSDDTELRGTQSPESTSVHGESAEERGVSSGSTRNNNERSDTTSGRSGLDGRSGNYRITESDEIGSGGAITKAKNNLAAIRLIKQLDEENRQATPEEQSILVKYVGWGGLVNMFPSTGNYKDGWEKHGEELKELLTKEEYEAARRSTINAHYTSEEVISWIWDALKAIGVNKPNGKVLEPAMGVGHFYGLNPNTNQKLFGVELDPISGKISQQLYPDADIRISGFENVTFPENFFDLAVGNVPFADIKPYDKKYNKGSRLSLHDYFFNKTLALTKPNGVVAFITSRYTMDKLDTKFRESVSKQADIIGAVRLPNTAFKGIANTEVTTDLIILKKRHRNTEPSELTRKFIETGQDASGVTINKYYLAHPDHMAGNMTLTGSMYGGNEPTLEPFKDRSLADVLNDITEKMKENNNDSSVNEDAETFVDRLQPDYSTEDVTVPHGTVMDAYFIDNGKLYQLDSGMPVLIRKRLPKQKVSETEKKFVFTSNDYDRIVSLTKIKAAMKDVMRTQLEEASASEKSAARKELNKLYDEFVKKHGFINTTKINVRPHPEKEGQEIVTKRYPNLLPFSLDPDQLLVSSIEEYNEETGKGVKGAIFKEDIVKLHREVQNVSSAADALVASLNKSGEVDLDYMSNIYGKQQDEIVEKLYGESIFFDPVQNKFVVSDEYLSGDVKQKLADAKNEDLQAIYPDSSFIDKNIMALEAVQPADIEPGDITARLGASWIPESDIQDFVNELIGSSKAKVSHNGKSGKWTIKLDDYSAKTSPANTSEWGTADVSAHKLIELALNLKQPTVRRTIYVDGNRTSVVDAEGTENATDKQARLKDRFEQWIWSDTARAQRLGRLYNDKFNNTVIRDFDGSHLTFPGMRPVGDWFKGLRPHQANVVWRILQQGNTLMAHTVGAGKTIAMVTAGMELKRLGLANKPTYVVPNHMLEQFSRELLQLYPTAKILVADKKNLDRKSRKGFVSKAATGNWDAIVITHSSFELLPVHPDTESVFVQNEIDNYEDLIREAKADSNRNITKELEKAKEKLKAKLTKLSNRDKKDTGIYFEETGIDFLFVDEAHLYKNLATPTKMKGKNLPGSGDPSQRATDMHMKVQYLNQKNPGRAAVFATGTPVANSMSELYIMQRYLQPDTLEKNGIEHFDSWAGTFGEMVTNLELDPTGAGLKIENRFAKFVNLPELMQMFRQVSDIKTATDLKLPVPKLKGGKAEIIEAKPSPEQVAYVEHLADRLKSIKGKRAEKGGDNALRIVNEGRSAALDMRTIDPDTYDFEGSKVNKAVDKIYQVWKDTKKNKSVQVVFLDRSMPNKGVFSVYEDMREKLVKAGIPLREIAFIHDYDSTDQKKARLFEDARAGKIRIVFGSTEKMGVGTNIQKRLYAMHHMDAPWRPADVEQRDGRILRQGNENEEIEIIRYVTSGTFDAYMWQTLEVKHNFITQVMRGDTSIREMEDLDGESALDPATVKAIASGNPRILDLAKMKADYKKLQRLQSAHVNEQVSIERNMQSEERYKSNSQKHLQLLQETKKAATIPEEFAITIDGKQYDKKKDEAGKDLLALAKKKTKGKDRDSVVDIGSYAGVNISARPSMGGVTIRVGEIREIGTDERTSPSGIIQSIENTIKNIGKSIADTQASIENHTKNIEKLASLKGKPFDKLNEMNQLKQEIADLEKELKEELEAKPEAQEETDNDRPSYLAHGVENGKISNAGKIHTTTEKLRAAIEKDKGISLPKGMFRRTLVHDSIVNAIRRGFGVEVVFFKNTRPDLADFSGVQIGDTIYINADSNYSYRQVLGHELIHQLRKTRPDLYDELVYIAAYKSGLNIEEIAKYKKTLDALGNKEHSTPVMIEESLADFVGEMFADPDILHRLEIKKPGFVSRFMEAISNFLKKALKRMRVYKDLRGSQYFNETQDLANAVEDILKRFKDSGKGRSFEEYTNTTSYKLDGEYKATSTKVMSDLKAFSEEVDKVLSGEIKHNQLVRVTDSLKYLKGMSIKDFPVMMSAGKIKSIMNKHGLTSGQIKNLARVIHDPIAVFHSRTINDSITVLVQANLAKPGEKREQGFAAVHINKSDYTIGDFHLIASYYGKDRLRDISKLFNKDDLIYMDERKARGWFHASWLQLPEEWNQLRADKTNLPLKDKIVKFGKQDDDSPMFLLNRPEEDEQLSNYEDVEQQIKDSYGLKTIGLMTKIKDWLQSVKDGFSRHFEHLDTREYGELTDVLRLHESVPERAKIKAAELMNRFLKDLNKLEYNIFNRYVILQDMQSDINKELLGDGHLPFGYETIDQVEKDFEKLQSKVTPKIRKAIDTRYRLMNKMRDTLVGAKLLPESVLENDTYFRHQVLEYMNLNEYATKPGTSSSDVRTKNKGWMKGRTGSTLNYNTNYIEAEFEFLSQAMAQLMTIKTLEKVKSLVDITPELTDGKNRRVKDQEIPEGYTRWQPEKGNSFYPVMSIPEKQIDLLLDGIITKDEIKTVDHIALGAKKLEWIIPEEVAVTLDDFRQYNDENKLGKVHRHMISRWKQWILINPVRWAKYNINNLSGDLDIVVAYNPKILKESLKAWRELWRFTTKNEQSDNIKEALDYGVIGSGLSVNEIPDINMQKMFKHLADPNENFLKKLFKDKAWGFLKESTNLRENWLRYAAFQHFKKELAQGKNIYAVSKKHEIDQISDNTQKAAKLARELLGDYGNISHNGQFIREHLIPFYSWMEVNTPRYVRLFKNLKSEGKSGAGALAVKSLSTTAKIGILYGLVSLWNMALFPDEDDELRLANRGQLHLILGRRDDGSIISLRVQGAFSDVLSWFSLEDLFADAKDLKEGKKTVGDQVLEMAKAPVNRLVNSSLPFVKAIGETLTGFTIYPDIANPRAITDRTEHFARLFSLDMIYRYAAGKPSPGLGDNLLKLVGYVTDPDMNYYYKTYEMIDNFNRKHNIDESGAHKPNKRGVILLELKRALRYADEDATKRYLEKYIKTYDGNIRKAYKGLKQSIRMSDPLMKVKKEYRRQFLEELSPKERDAFDRARQWYKDTYKDYMKEIKWSDFRDIEK